jgi:protein SCO1
MCICFLDKKNSQLSLKPIFISVDPNRDSVGQLRVYKSDFHPDFEFLTGTPDQIAAATRAYRVYFSKVGKLCYIIIFYAYFYNL